MNALRAAQAFDASGVCSECGGPLLPAKNPKHGRPRKTCGKPCLVARVRRLERERIGAGFVVRPVVSVSAQLEPDDVVITFTLSCGHVQTRSLRCTGNVRGLHRQCVECVSGSEASARG